MPTWQDVAAKASAARLAAIPAEWRLADAEIDAAGDHGGLALIESKLSEEERRITALTASEAVAKLASGELKSAEVTRAMCHRAALAQQLTNCLTEIFFDEAIKRAEGLDAEFAKTGKPTGPLHGLPVSIKDDQDKKGTRTTWGFIAWYDDISERDSSVVQILLGAGAVLYCKTNVPQALMTWESDNHLWGHVRNIHNRKLGAGGSSGGEGCIVSCGASFLGVGSDIGGSVRLPASINGVYGLKPSARRFPNAGCKALDQGSPDLIVPTNGPLGRSVDDLELYTRLLVQQGPAKDPECIPMAWTPAKLPAKLRFGYFIDTDMYRVVPPVRRVIEGAVAALKAEGHEVVEFPVSDALEIWALGAGQIFGAYNDRLFEVLKKGGEDLIDGMKWVAASEPKTVGVGDLWDYHNHRNAVRERWLARMLEAGIDGIVCPTTGLPSTPHHQSATNVHACVYTVMYNLLDLSAGVVPGGKVLASDAVPADFKAQNELEGALYGFYTPETYLHAPIGVQVVAGRLQEEKVLELMKVVDAAIKKASKK
ncbi:general amidase [Hyaloraphidium curvatum]|nr:general amidase [Hyaloraphidium curvatum]